VRAHEVLTIPRRPIQVIVIGSEPGFRQPSADVSPDLNPARHLLEKIGMSPLSIHCLTNPERYLQYAATSLPMHAVAGIFDIIVTC
jgi:hypothetical protein